MALYEGKTEAEAPEMYDDYGCLSPDTARRMKIEPPKDTDNEVRLDGTDEDHPTTTAEGQTLL